MLTMGEPLSGKQLVGATFMPDDVPDERLFRRMRIMGDGMLRSVLEEGDERPVISDNYFCRLATTRSAGGSAVRTACATVRS